jgi:hypothetical protein
MEPWETLFERAAAHELTVEDVRRALAERRESDD